MREIELSRGYIAVVDDEDYDDLAQYTWSAQQNPWSRSVYAKRSIHGDGEIKAETMHRRIMGLNPGDTKRVLHLNRNTLDNRKANLKVVAQIKPKAPLLRSNNMTSVTLTELELAAFKGCLAEKKAAEDRLSRIIDMICTAHDLGRPEGECTFSVNTDNGLAGWVVAK